MTKLEMRDGDHDNFTAGEDIMFSRPGSYAEVRETVRKATASRVTVEAAGRTEERP